MVQSERVVVDSNFWVALFNSWDSLYPKASKVASQLDKNKTRLVLTNLIFLETVTVLSQRRGRRAAIETGEYLLANPNIEKIHIDSDLQKSSWQIFKEIANKNASFVDCSTIAVMKAEGLHRLLTFDLQDFKPLSKKYRFGLYNIS